MPGATSGHTWTHLDTPGPLPNSPSNSPHSYPNIPSPQLPPPGCSRILSRIPLGSFPGSPWTWEHPQDSHPPPGLGTGIGNRENQDNPGCSSFPGSLGVEMWKRPSQLHQSMERGGIWGLFPDFDPQIHPFKQGSLNPRSSRGNEHSRAAPRPTHPEKSQPSSLNPAGICPGNPKNNPAAASRGGWGVGTGRKCGNIQLGSPSTFPGGAGGGVGRGCSDGFLDSGYPRITRLEAIPWLLPPRCRHSHPESCFSQGSAGIPCPFPRPHVAFPRDGTWGSPTGGGTGGKRDRSLWIRLDGRGVVQPRSCLDEDDFPGVWRREFPPGPIPSGSALSGTCCCHPKMPAWTE